MPAYASDFEELFSLDSTKTIRIQISESEWNGLLNDVDHNRRSEVYRHANFFYGEDLATAEQMADVGFRIRGNVFSRKRPEDGTTSLPTIRPTTWSVRTSRSSSTKSSMRTNRPMGHRLWMC